MFYHLSERITAYFETQQVIDPKKRELYRYGVQQGFTILLNVITAVTISLLCGMLLQGLLFLAAYIPLRSYAGGYHAKTPIRCYLLSAVMILAVLLVMRFVLITDRICLIILGIASGIVLLLAPVEDQHKPLDAAEIRVYRRRTCLLWLTELLFAVVCLGLQLRETAVCLAITLLVMAVMLVLGYWKNHILHKRAADEGKT